MECYYHIHTENPQVRLLKKTVQILEKSGVIVYPTDSTYALGCLPGNKTALERICRIRNLNEKHHFTLICRDLKDISKYAWVNTPQFRILKASTPGPFTFILKATKEVPRQLIHKKKKTIGIRIPDCNVARELLNMLEHGLLTTSLIMPGEDAPLSDPLDIKDRIGSQVDVILDSGIVAGEVTTLVDLTDEIPVILRQGGGMLDSA